MIDPAFVGDGQRGVKTFGPLSALFGKPGVRRNHNKVGQSFGCDCLAQNRERIEVINRDFEESLDLRGM